MTKTQIRGSFKRKRKLQTSSQAFSIRSEKTPVGDQQLVHVLSPVMLWLALYIITSKPAQEDIITVVQAAVCRPLTLTHCCVDIHRQSRTWGPKCGAVRLPGGAPASRLQWRQLWPGNLFCHRRHWLYTWWESAESDRGFSWTQCTTTLEKLRPNDSESELKWDSLEDEHT